MSARSLTVLLACCLGSVAHAEADGTAAAEMAAAQRCLDRSDYDCAVSHFERARTLSPKSSGPWLGLGLAQAASGHCELALPALEEYLLRKPRDPNPGAVSTRNTCRAQLAQTPQQPPLAEVPAPRYPPPPLMVSPPSIKVSEENAPGAMLTAPPPRPAMKPWKAGLIAGAVLVVAGGVIAGSVLGALASRQRESVFALEQIP